LQLAWTTAIKQLVDKYLKTADRETQCHSDQI
jgi:hypothetical protein